MTPNPLLARTELPDFSAIDASHVLPALEQVLIDSRAELAALAAATTAPSWANLVVPFERLRDRISEVFSPVGHLHGVADSEPLREAYDKGIQLLTAWETELRQSAPLYQRLKTLLARPGEIGLDRVQQKILGDEILDFELSGVGLPQAEREEFKALALELSEASNHFETQVLDSTEAWRYTVSDPAELLGLPAEVVAAAQRRAGGEGHVFDLKTPTYIAIMSYATDRGLRERLYRAWATRASEQGEFDNTDTMLKILKLRQREAQLLGSSDYVALSLKTKMATSAAQVEIFLQDLATRARPSAIAQLAELQAFAQSELGLAALEPWDMGYAQEALKLKQFSIDDALLKPYFPAERTVAGLFKFAEQLFGIQFLPRSDVPVWHADVRYFELRDAQDALIGGVYLDLYARTGKRSGAWMDVCRTRSNLGAVKHPVAYLTLNAEEPSGDRPSLFSHDDVVTLFHEFGHGIHHLLSEVDYPSVSGVNGVEWDAVELPSQLFENFCYAPEVLQSLGRHFETDVPIPVDLIEKIIASKNFMAGLFLLRQIEFALLDLRLHQAHPAPASLSQVQALIKAVRDEVALVQPPAWNRASHSFTHIFSGGYAAGYYSYLWAELLSADAFGLFEELGVMAPAAASKLREEILARGGSRPAADSFRAFRGRDPEPEALLRSYGLAA